MEDRLLGVLRSNRGEYVSGEELCKSSGVSRAAIWKQIEKLREEGYRILAQPHLGYRLVSIPDRLIPEELQWQLPAKIVGRKIYSYAATDSTMDVAHQLVDAGEAEGSVVFAEAQRRGRGRLGRTWVSAAGRGISMSVIFRPAMELSQAPLFTLMAAAAIVQAIRDSVGIEPQIKWPNDILIRDKKVAGILTEMKAELNQVHAVVIGIGLNVNTPRHLLPRLATSLSLEQGRPCDRLQVARALMIALDEFYARVKRGDARSIFKAWRSHSMTLGRRVRVACQDRHVDGEAVDLSPQGALVIRTDEGRMEQVTAGEVLIVR
ncbi:MAG: biotin--[acetyl-CoA-carboxylase] ligase [Candidatus Omnitrophica bacterium]|nr:biotin--[acetyl-CoA-carboxylase] ligase [Candidatus Omnitrophota bacterium]